MKKKIFNPSPRSFTVRYDINEDSNPVEYTIEGLTSEEFPEPVANHIAQHLAKEIAFKDGWQGSNYQDKYNEVKKKIEHGF